MASTYRITITDIDGTETVLSPVTQDQIDELTDLHEVRDSLCPVGVVERERRDGSWASAGGWDVRPRVNAPEQPVARHFEDLDAVARVNDAREVREARADRYHRTGK